MVVLGAASTLDILDQTALVRVSCLWIILPQYPCKGAFRSAVRLAKFTILTIATLWHPGLSASKALSRLYPSSQTGRLWMNGCKKFLG